MTVKKSEFLFNQISKKNLSPFNLFDKDKIKNILIHKTEF